LETCVEGNIILTLFLGNHYLVAVLEMVAGDFKVYRKSRAVPAINKDSTNESQEWRHSSAHS
jgi:hypothetical protein